jgi:multidrug efflux pump subunit AcrA (membrane-fusion protein)
LLFVFLVPVPVSRIRQTALVELQPDATIKVPVDHSAVLKRIMVVDGQRVEKDQPLAEFRDRELENRLREAETQVVIRTDKLHAVERALDAIQDEQERKRLQLSKVQLETELSQYARSKETLEEQIKALTLVAPRAGVVIAPPRPDEVDRYWDKDQRGAFCTLSDPTRLRALVPVSAADYDLLKRDEEALRQRNRELEATIRVQGRVNDTWRGQLAPLPPSEVKDLPWQLTTRGGGPIAIKPGAPNGANVPQSQLYLVSVNFVDPDHAVYPGTMGQVKIHCEWRTCAWWVWRTISDTFDLKLM